MRNEDLLIEIGTEELPPGLLKTLTTELAKNLGRELDEEGFSFKEVKLYGSPRRLATTITLVSERQAERQIEKRGPSIEVAFSKTGQPTRALEGFLKSCGIADADTLGRLKSDKGEWVVFRESQKGKCITERIQGIVERSLARLSISKPMRWGSRREEFVRPVHWIVALYGKRILDVELFGCKSSDISYGHRFMHPGPIRINSAEEYVETCRSVKVIVNLGEREEIIKGKVKEEADKLGGIVELEEALVEEVSGLVEWPEVLSGKFEERFLAVPEEALISAMRKHQRYFHLKNEKGELMNRFIAVTNIISKNPGVVIAGNERVIKPRLTDAEFFFSKDTEGGLEEKLDKLEKVVFQSEIGSYKEKAVRVSDVSSFISRKAGWDEQKAARAGLLCKADLVSDMVEEFPDLQGIMGGYYAALNGEDDEICSAIKCHYMPNGAGDDTPSEGIGSALAIADKLDTLVSIFAVGGAPTGSKDPYALRRQALGVIRIILANRLDIDIKECLAETRRAILKSREELAQYHFDIEEVYEFIMDRLVNVYQDAGIQSDVVKAVRGQDGGIRDLSEADEYIKVIHAQKNSANLRCLVALSKRVANILSGVDEKALPAIRKELYEGDAERNLDNRMQEAEEQIAKAGDPEAVLEILAQQAPAIEDYFEKVLVMVEEEEKRLNRLASVARVKILFLAVADFKVLRLS